MKRREFLTQTWQTAAKLAAGAAASSQLGGCTSIDRLFSTDRETQENEVIIVGAGAAGLMAGLELKKRNISFRLFEASSRVGGRVYSLEHQPEIGQAIELGAESFYEQHQIIFDLAQEMNLEIQEMDMDPRLESLLLYANNRWWPSKEIRKNLVKLSAQMNRLRLTLLPAQRVQKRDEFLYSPEAQNLDQLTVPELFARKKISIDPFWSSYLESDCRRNLGAGLKEVSALAWLLQIEKEGRSRQKYQLTGGFHQLTYSLYGRLAGVIPEFRVRLQSPLVEIKRKNSFFNLKFKTPQGIKYYQSRYLILAMPFAQLAKIQGLYPMLGDDEKVRALSAIQTSQPSKNVLVFKEPFWRQKMDSVPANQGNWQGGSLQFSTWDSTWPRSKKKGILSILHYPSASVKESTSLIVQELSKLYPKISSSMIDDSFSMSWGQREFINGDQLIFRPGMFSQFGAKIWSPSFDGHLQWAGDFTSIHETGTVAGALESGKRAALQISQIYHAI